MLCPDVPQLKLQNIARTHASHDPSLPVYVRVAAVIRSEILSGIYAHGASLPTEAEFAERFAVARLTMRRALETLALDGLVVRRPGKGHGTRVNLPDGVSPDRLSTDELFRRYREWGEDSTIETVLAETRPASLISQGHLRCQADALTYSIVRRRLVGNRPYCIFANVMIDHTAEGIRDELRGAASVILLLEQKGFRISEAEQIVSAAVADATMAKWLDCSTGDAIINVTRVIFTDEGTPIEYISLSFRASDYQYKVSLARDPLNEVSFWSMRGSM